MTGDEKKGENYPIPRVFCGAKTRQGGQCKQPAMKNGRCRLHGGKSLSGTAHGRYVHGYYTKEAFAMRKKAREKLRLLNSLLSRFA